MTFVQVEFLVFFAVVFAAYWAIRERRAQNLLLVVASAVFYGWVHPWFVALLAFTAGVDFFAARQMERQPRSRKAALAASLVANLGMLATFKYLDFFIENVAAALAAIGLPTSLHTLGIFLPVGISFYTFQALSYTIDVYRGKLRARHDPLDYATFIVLFPQLVAGPVERARNLLVQVEAPRAWSTDRLRSGLLLAAWGAVQKVVVADTVAMYVDRVFAAEAPSAGMVAAGSVGFAVQILADFSGYTDIARGTARMLGFELVENFKSPYLATSPSDFWRRWHVSFSSWIHEYLYVPLGGSRLGAVRTALATYGAMLLSGLWHGASWNFVLWGGYHATLLTVWRHLPSAPRVPAAVKIAGMFVATCFGWLLFREQRLDRLLLYATLPAGGEEHAVVARAVLAVSVAFGGVLAVGGLAQRHLLPRLRASPGWPAVESALVSVATAVVFVFARDKASEFIYFQF
ncbi:MAG: MBOAT family O-acyltransferase [Myxococcota bacterium]